MEDKKKKISYVEYKPGDILTADKVNEIQECIQYNEEYITNVENKFDQTTSYTKVEIDNKLNGKVDVKNLVDYVKFTDYATDSKAGVVKVGISKGIGIAPTDQELYVNTLTTGDIAGRKATIGTLSMELLNHAVKAALTDSKRISNMTEDEKQNARDVIGAISLNDIANKVDKVSNKGLSTNDYSNEDKNKVIESFSVKHSHDNKSLLDTIDETKTTLWDTGAQQTPLFANTTSECTDTTKVYVLPDGCIYAYINGVWTNTGHKFVVTETLNKVIEATCNSYIIHGENYNLLKPSTVSFSSRLQDDVEGITTSTTTNAVTDWIPVKEGKFYTLSYSKDGSRINSTSGDGLIIRINAKKADGSIVIYNKYPKDLCTTIIKTGKAYIVPNDIVAMRFHFQCSIGTVEDISTIEKLKTLQVMIVEGNSAIEAVNNSLTKTYIDGDSEIPITDIGYTLKKDSSKQDKNNSPYFRNVDYGMIPTQYYKGVGTSYNTTFGKNTTYTTFIEALDALITNHSGYVTKTNLGVASDNQNLYLYDFKPVRIAEQKTPIPKIIITGCHHGWEKADIFGLYYFIDNLLNKWNQHPSLEYLRNNVELKILPVVNPYGFDHLTYKNGNEVNINRNYDSNWVLVEDATSQQYGSTSPFDQPESQIVRDLVLSNLDASLVIDFHTNSSTSAVSLDKLTYYGVCKNLDEYYSRMIDVVSHQLTNVSANFNIDYELNTPDSTFGYITTSSGNGIFRQWATDQNCVGVLVEGLTGFPNKPEYSADAYKADEEIIVNYIITALNYLAK